MIEKNGYHKRFNLSLEVGDQRIELPVRKVVAENIEQQIQDGVPYEFNSDFFLKLDGLLNYSLEREYQAPTPPQVNLVVAIMQNLEIEAEGHALTKKEDAGAFITRHRNAFDAACAAVEV